MLARWRLRLRETPRVARWQCARRSQPKSASLAGVSGVGRAKSERGDILARTPWLREIGQRLRADCKPTNNLSRTVSLPSYRCLGAGEARFSSFLEAELLADVRAVQRPRPSIAFN